MRFALLSQVPETVSIDLLQRLAKASIPVLADIAKAWSTVDPSITAPDVRVVEKVEDLTDEDVPVLFVGQLPPEDAADLAFHDVRLDSKGTPRPYALVLAEKGMDQATITQSAFHEMAEAEVDKDCNLYDSVTRSAFQLMAGMTANPTSTATAGTAVRVAREICDPVQNDGIVRDGILLSAWVTPAWFGLGTGPCAVSDEGFDLAPGALRPGGYVIHEDGTQDPPGYRPPHHKDHAHSRAAKRERARIAAALKETLPAGGAPVVVA